MYCVYWTYRTTGDIDCFRTDNLKDALIECEVARKQNFAFVTMVSENPNQVGKKGVADPDANYDWPKRR